MKRLMLIGIVTASVLSAAPSQADSQHASACHVETDGAQYGVIQYGIYNASTTAGVYVFCPMTQGHWRYATVTGFPRRAGDPILCSAYMTDQYGGILGWISVPPLYKPADGSSPVTSTSLMGGGNASYWYLRCMIPRSDSTGGGPSYVTTYSTWY